MPFQSVPDTAQITIVFTTNGVPAVNVLHATKIGGYDQAALDALAAAVDEWASTDYIARMNASTTYVRTEVKGLENASDLQATNDDGAGATGGAGAGQAANVAKAFTLRSNFTGRSQRGRLFMPGIPNSSMSSLIAVNQTFVDDVLDILEALRVILEAINWIWSIVSRYNNGVLRPTGNWVAVSSFGVSSLRVNSQRGRTL